MARKSFKVLVDKHLTEFVDCDAGLRCWTEFIDRNVGLRCETDIGCATSYLASVQSSPSRPVPSICTSPHPTCILPTLSTFVYTKISVTASCGVSCSL